MNRQSKRFTSSKWMDRLVPILFILLGLGLIFALGLIFVSFF